jgi:signal peptidase I
MDSADDQIASTGTASPAGESVPATAEPVGADSGIKDETAVKTGEVKTEEIDQSLPGRPLATGHDGHDLVRTLGTDMVGSVQSLLGTVVIAVFVITFIVQAFQIPSESMMDTLLVGDYLLVNKLCYGERGADNSLVPYQKIARGDIIVFHYPVDPKQHFVKRVIGIPGDKLRLVNKQVLINGVPLNEPYVKFLFPPDNMFRDNFPRLDAPITLGLEGKWWLEMRKLVEDGQLIVPDGHYFVMGDNRDDSEDSRYWGFVPRENIIGRPLLIYWSVRTWDGDPASSLSGKLYHIAYAVTHVFQITRWNRTLRLVH